MRILAPTIMHSGSHALWYGILNDWKHRDIHPYPVYTEALEENACLIGHLTDKHMNHWKSWLGMEVVIMPMRHPAKVLESHYARLEYDQRWIMWFNQNWLNAMWIEEHHAPYYIHIDQPELRDRELAIINDELGLSLEHDWAINGKMGCKEGTHATKLREDLVHICPEAYVRYYEETLDA